METTSKPKPIDTEWLAQSDIGQAILTEREHDRICHHREAVEALEAFLAEPSRADEHRERVKAANIRIAQAEAELAEANARVTKPGEDRARVERDQQRALAKIALARSVRERGGASLEFNHGLVLRVRLEFLAHL